MKLIVVNTDFDIGGGELSLVSFLNNIDLDKYEVSLGLLQPKLGLCDRISTKINIIKLYENPSLPYFDVAIGYKQGKSSSYVINKVPAKRKILIFRHGNIKYKGLVKLYYKNIYKKADCVVTLNEDLKEKVAYHFSIPFEKIKVIGDFFDREDFISKSREYSVKSEAKRTFLTVARLVPVKKIDLIPYVANNLIKSGFSDFKWFVLGDYKDIKYYKKIKDLTDKFNLSDKVVLEGERENPMPYYAISDIYVHLAEAESWCRSITEALIFGVPVLTTDTIGGMAQITSGVNGEICRINDIDDITKKFIPMIEQIEDIKAKQQPLIPDNQKVMEEYYRLF
ncbi:MAG: glycosyltransferase [Abditibacteriota bacterium]|nr:glycosyltransferase [Abditibacteriota bacterium]